VARDPMDRDHGGARRAGPSGKPAGRGRVSGPLGPVETGTDRPAQVGAEIRRALQAELARGLNDPRVQGLVSITEVTVLPDLTEARIGVSVMPEERAPLTLSGLRAAAGFLRRRLMDETRIRRVPRLLFEGDESLKRQARLDEAIRAGAAETASGHDSGDAPDSDAPQPETGTR
jgi:ribosome-binding factor A